MSRSAAPTALRLQRAERALFSSSARLEALRAVTLMVLAAMMAQRGEGQAYIAALRKHFSEADVISQSDNPVFTDAFLDEFSAAVQSVIAEINVSLPAEQQTPAAK